MPTYPLCGYPIDPAFDGKISNYFVQKEYFKEMV